MTRRSHRHAARARIAGLGRPDDRGITLVEVQVAALIGLLMAGMAFTALFSTMRAGDGIIASSAQFDAGMVGTERLGADLEDARAVVGVPATATTATAVTLWLDDNADYMRQPGELITWNVDGQGRLCRTAGSAAAHCVGLSRERATLAFTFGRVPSTLRISQVGVTLAHGTDDPTPRTWSVALENSHEH
ncbi:hypothetical protein CLV92_105108 [Kineococcus xinjiangensis]|uniref:Prepilin-type N-terminal cleavage/methylation domain-containing protein n=1 Tax=Kineococcus xinjiangensis TaxID=512762 RepID=A0A2S6IP74_9ACTN|nr:hypothetical protein [Kineococcus xinjiangensis]PPK96008.1 hypothetical protein CLV92_105108 [Kineococcus xinjiangensis]